MDECDSRLEPVDDEVYVDSDKLVRADDLPLFMYSANEVQKMMKQCVMWNSDGRYILKSDELDDVVNNVLNIKA